MQYHLHMIFYPIRSEPQIYLTNFWLFQWLARSDVLNYFLQSSKVKEFIFSYHFADLSSWYKYLWSNSGKNQLVPIQQMASYKWTDRKCKAKRWAFIKWYQPSTTLMQPRFNAKARTRKFITYIKAFITRP